MMILKCICFTDSLYPYCAWKNYYVLGEPEVIIGEKTKDFQWKGDELHFTNKDGVLTPVEGLILCRVCLPRDVAPKLRGIPFLPQKVREKSVAAECGLCLQVIRSRNENCGTAKNETLFSE